MSTASALSLGGMPGLRRRVFGVLAGFKGAPKLATAFILLTAFMAIFADVITPHNPLDVKPQDSKIPPAFVSEGTTNYLLGTDRLGRDILSRLIWGARVSLAVVGAAIAVGGGVGSTIGLLAGYRGGWTEAILMRVVDATIAVPAFLLALVFAITIGPKFWVVVLILAFTVWAQFARLVRGETLALKERDFVALAHVAGASGHYIVLRHILPNLMSSVIVLATLQVGWVILTEAGLSFLGAGIPRPTPTWGGMVADGRNYIETTWWIAFSPGIAIMLVVLSFNIFGDWLRDTWDPKLRNL